MSPDAVLISRIQFAFTIGYHILWPAWTIGISGFIVILNVLWLRTQKRSSHKLLRKRGESPMVPSDFHRKKISARYVSSK